MTMSPHKAPRNYRGDLDLEAKFYKAVTGEDVTTDDLYQAGAAHHDAAAREHRARHDDGTARSATTTCAATTTVITDWAFDKDPDMEPFTEGTDKMDRDDFQTALGMVYGKFGWDETARLPHGRLPRRIRHGRREGRAPVAQPAAVGPTYPGRRRPSLPSPFPAPALTYTGRRVCHEATISVPSSAPFRGCEGSSRLNVAISTVIGYVPASSVRFRRMGSGWPARAAPARIGTGPPRRRTASR